MLTQEKNYRPLTDLPKASATPVIKEATDDGKTDPNEIPTVSIAELIKGSNDDEDYLNLLIDYHKLAADGKISDVLYRDGVIEKMLVALVTAKHPNVLLIGDAGVGKTAIVEALAVRLFNKDKLVSQMLGSNTKIYELRLSDLVADSSLVGILEKKLRKITDFISDPDNHALLYLDEIHQLLTNRELQNVAEILKPALSRGDMHVIGATTTQEMKFWRRNPALNRRFSNVIVPELTDAQTIQVLTKIAPSLQTNLGSKPTTLDHDVLKYIIATSNQNKAAMATHQPDAAITTLDQSLALAKLQANQPHSEKNCPKSLILSKQVVDHASAQLTNRNFNELTLKRVEQIRHQLDCDIIGQSKAKKVIIKALQSLALNLVPQVKPHSFLLAGASGTGKTELAKCLAEQLFGSRNRLLYLNLTEYANPQSLTRLIGSSLGYVGSESAQPLPLDSLKTCPAQIVVLDELEKAAPEVQRVFMQALDEGKIQLNDGSTVPFANSIVIATTNAGTAAFQQKTIGFGTTQQLSENEIMQALAKDFPSELLGRFEAIAAFDPITKEAYQKIVAIKLKKMLAIIKLNQPLLGKKIASIDYSRAIDEIVAKSYIAAKGGRPAQRAVQQYLEEYLVASY